MQIIRYFLIIFFFVNVQANTQKRLRNFTGHHRNTPNMHRRNNNRFNAIARLRRQLQEKSYRHNTNYRNLLI